jgi:hypothetical protein
MKRKSPQDVQSDLGNADLTALTKEDESSDSGEDSPEFNPMTTFGRTNQPAPSLEKSYSASPEEIFKAEQEIIKGATPDYPTLIAMKEEESEMQQLAQLREAQKKPVNQTPAAQLPQHALPPRSPPSVPPRPPPQIPGAATNPPADGSPGAQPSLNPFADYQPPQKPESGLPYKPKSMPPDFTPLPDMKVTKHDCLTVHGYQKHEDWEAEQQQKFFRR